MDAKVNVWRCDGCGEMLPGPDLDLDMAKCKCETGRWRVCSVTAVICASMQPVRKAEDLAAANLAAANLAAANLAANKRIVELEHERDAARAELVRLTTPRPIAEAPRDGTWILGCWPESNEWPPIVMHWTGKEWQREDPAERDEGYMPTHYLPLPR